MFCKIKGNKMRPGNTILIDDEPHRCTKIVQGKRGKGGGFVRATLKGVVSGNTFEKTFTSDEIIETAELEKETASFSYKDGNTYIFINSDTYEECQVGRDCIDDLQFLAEGQECKLLKFRNDFIGVTLPIIAEFTVLAVDPTKGVGKEVPGRLNSGAVMYVFLYSYHLKSKYYSIFIVWFQILFKKEPKLK